MQPKITQENHNSLCCLILPPPQPCPMPPAPGTYFLNLPIMGFGCISPSETPVLSTRQNDLRDITEINSKSSKRTDQSTENLANAGHDLGFQKHDKHVCTHRMPLIMTHDVKKECVLNSMPNNIHFCKTKNTHVYSTVWQKL